MTTTIKPGDIVRLKRGVTSSCPVGRDNNVMAQVKTLLPDVEGGLFMEQDLRGCRYWNVADVELVSPK